MNLFDIFQVLVFFGLIILLTPLFGTYIADIFSGGTPSGTAAIPYRALGWLERITYRVAGVDEDHEMTWTEYTWNLLTFNLIGFFILFLILLSQYYLPLNPQGLKGLEWTLAFNTATSFATNTSWQSYPGETTLSYFSQMVGLSVQQFTSSSIGIGILMALTRGIIRKSVETIGNFWVDLTRSIIYLLLPLALILALVLVGQGIVQTFSPYIEITPIESATPEMTKQIIPLGPVASQIATKQLGVNGGGYFNTNGAHPFENPTAISNFIQMICILLIPSALTYTYGIMTGSRKQGWVIFYVIAIIWFISMIGSIASEYTANPAIAAYPNLEGKESRFGVTNSLIWSISSTTTGNGSVNAMMSSLSPIAGGLAMFNIMLGELAFGGIGVGMANILIFTLFTVFISGLLVGRTPEYLGKKIEKHEIRWVMISMLTPGALILIGSGISSILPIALNQLGNQGPHGLTELIYAFSSTSRNNGSSFAGLQSDTPYFNITFSILMILGRLAIIIPSLAVAGLLAKKKTTPSSSGTFSTDTNLFAILTLIVIFVVGGLSFFPPLCLGPVVEQLLMLKGRTF